MSEIVATGDDPTFPRMAELPKLVFSKTLKPPLTWANTPIIDHARLGEVQVEVGRHGEDRARTGDTADRRKDHHLNPINQILVPESVLGVAGRRWKSAADAVRDRRATGHGDRAHPALRRLPELVRPAAPGRRRRTGPADQCRERAGADRATIMAPAHDRPRAHAQLGLTELRSVRARARRGRRTEQRRGRRLRGRAPLDLAAAA